MKPATRAIVWGWIVLGILLAIAVPIPISLAMYNEHGSGAILFIVLAFLLIGLFNAIPVASGFFMLKGRSGGWLTLTVFSGFMLFEGMGELRDLIGSCVTGRVHHASLTSVVLGILGAISLWVLWRDVPTNWKRAADGTEPTEPQTTDH